MEGQSRKKIAPSLTIDFVGYFHGMTMILSVLNDSSANSSAETRPSKADTISSETRTASEFCSPTFRRGRGQGQRSIESPSKFSQC